LKVLYIGGTGEISFDCIKRSAASGHDVSVYNRGNHNDGLPPSCNFITGDITDDTTYGELAKQNFDVVCQFRLFSEEALQRDLDLFAGHCGQYVFIGTASSYQSPLRTLPITEETPLINPYWGYSRAKAAMEAILQAQDALPFTIVRPSHTYRTNIPPTAVARETNVSRLLRGKPVVMHGDGSSLWTLTHAEDFAPLFVGLLGNDRAMGEAFHITHDKSWPWDEILEAAAAALGVKDYRVVHVPSDTLIRFNPEWEGPLLGDKTPSVIFNNSKVKSVAGDHECRIDPWAGMKLVAERFPVDPEAFDAEEDALLDRIAAGQDAVGR
jgi:nucleoside-diphosphate-sugar epimerase